jgi:hypothetical protein
LHRVIDQFGIVRGRLSTARLPSFRLHSAPNEFALRLKNFLRPARHFRPEILSSTADGI